MLAGFSLLIPVYGDNYVTAIAISVATFSILGLGLNIVVGFAGLLDLGYAALFAIGAYTTGILTTKWGINFWLSLPLSMIAAGFTGAIIGYPTLRLRSDYLAIVTLGFGEIVRISFTNWDYVGGPDGIWNIPAPSILGYRLNSPNDFYVLTLALLVAAWMLARNLADSRMGRGWMAIREDEFAAEAIGVPTLRLKLLAYVMGGMWGGIAGSFFAARLGLINPQSFTYLASFTVLVIVVLGGMGSLPGVLMGATVIIGLPEVLRSAQQYRMVMFALGLIVLMLIRPQGLWPQTRRQRAPTGAVGGLEREEVSELPDYRVSGGRGEVILEVRELAQQFGGILALDNVSLRVHRGEILSIIGPNGAGKTTLFNCITGVQRPLRGNVYLNGKSVLGLRPHRIAARGIGRTFQGIRLFRQMTVFENILAGLYPRHQTWTWEALFHTRSERNEEQHAFATAHLWTRFVGIGALADRLADELSYADQRRVEIARALASNPTLVLLDEPAAGMNPTEKAQFMGLVRRIRELGITVVLIEHDMAVVMSVSDRILVLDRGRMIAEGTAAEIQTSPAVIEAYLGRDEDESDVAAVV
jgi:branched-chain amino acid transport system permease protein